VAGHGSFKPILILSVIAALCGMTRVRGTAHLGSNLAQPAFPWLVAYVVARRLTT